MDGQYEYRHVVLPKLVFDRIKAMNSKRLFNELEWRDLGVQQSRGWVHYTWHRPEPHILMFRRAIGTVSWTIFLV
jgi:cyclin-dependent kinase regulatory subunit CKS1